MKSILDDLAFNRRLHQVVGLTVEQYHAMIRQGIVPEGSRIELLDGMLVATDRSQLGDDPNSVGDAHRFAVGQLARLNVELEPRGCFMQTQQPVTLPPRNEPEPDGAIIRGTNDDYRHRKPMAADTVCVIEVADNSLSLDRTTKLGVYAQADIGQYLIVNLVDQLVEVYREPHRDTFLAHESLRADEPVVIALPDGEFSFAAAFVLTD